MRRIYFLVVIVFLVFQEYSVAGETGNADVIAFKSYYLLGIANNTFPDNMPKLNSDVHLTDITNVLNRTIKPKCQVVLNDKDSTTIIKGFSDFKEKVEKDSNIKLVIIYISSHGEVKNPYDNSDYYLLCNGGTEICADTLIDKVNELSNISNTTVLLCLDTCHSGAILKRDWTGANKGHLLVITSCGPDEKSSEFNKKTYLSQGFCKAFTSHEAFNDMFLSIRSLENFIIKTYPTDASGPMITCPNGNFAHNTIIYKYKWERDFIPWTKSKEHIGWDTACWAGMGLSAAVLGGSLCVEGIQIGLIKNNREKGLDTLPMREAGKNAAIVSAISAGTLLASYLIHSFVLLSESNGGKSKNASLSISPYSDTFGAGMTLAFKF